MIVDFQDNVLYVDYFNWRYNMTIYNNTSKRIPLLLGQITDDNKFDVTIETIKYLPEDLDLKVRDFIRNIFNI